MKLKSVEKSSDIKLQGIEAEVVKNGASIVRVVLRDAHGGYLEVAKDGYSDLAVRIIAPPTKKEAWVLQGNFMNLPEAKVEESFNHEHEATDKLRQLARSAGKEESELGLTIARREVEVPE